MKFQLFISFLSLSLTKVNAVCEQKCENAKGQGHICTGERTFIICNEGNRASDDKKIYECPLQYFCVTAAHRCERNAIPTCRSGCGVCNPSTGIACISKKIFAFCFDKNIPNFDVTGTCDKDNEFCNANEKSFCKRDEFSCNSIDVITPTPGTPTGSTPADIMAFCRTINQGGKFTPPGDKTCIKYNYCYMSRRQIMGKQYSCPGDKVFDCQSQQCSDQCNNKCLYPGLNPLQLYRTV